jgi:hypothetical protein
VTGGRYTFWRFPRRWGSLLILALVPLCGAAPAPPDRKLVIEPTKVGQPANYSKAIGMDFKVETHATPTELQVNEPLTLTVRVTAIGRWQAPPERPDLARIPSFAKRFHIQKDPPRPDREVRELQAWEFSYRLRPKSTSVTDIPPLLFVYYRPGVIPPEKGYRTVDAEPIPLTVKPAIPPEELKPIEAPEEAFHLQPIPSGATVAELSRGLVVTVLLLVPPVGCLVWYLVWSRLYPDAARLARQRRSWAARKALAALEASGSPDPAEQARRSAAVLADYLRDRYDLSGGEPTPAEVTAHLHRCGLAVHLTEQTADFFRACDLARFTPDPPLAGSELKSAAVRLVLALEAESCPAS